MTSARSPEKRTGNEPEARLQAKQSRIDGSPILTLRQWFHEEAGKKKFAPDVARYIDRLFDRIAAETPDGWNGVPSIPLAEAARTTERLFIEIMLARVERAMLATGPLDKGFFTLSKASSLWLSLRHRLASPHRPKGGRQNGDAPKRIPPRAETAEEVDDEAGLDADTASDSNVR